MAAPIDKLTIKGFKSFRALSEFPLTRRNLLIGANGAGKSNFVEFFRLIRAMSDERLGGFVNLQGGSDPLFFQGQKHTLSIDAELSFGDNSYAFSLIPAFDGRSVVINEERYRYKHSMGWEIIGRGKLESLLKLHKDDKSALFPKSPGVGHHVYESISNWVVYHFHDTSIPRIERPQKTVRDYSELRPDGENIAAYLFRLRESKRDSYDAICDTVRLVAPFFDDFLLTPRKSNGDEVVVLDWKQKGSSFPFHPLQLSDGTLRFICLATALLQPNPPATLVFDEPELGLHPYALSVLAGLFQQFSTVPRRQFIVATQSPLLVDWFDPADIITVDRIDGASVFVRHSVSELSEWLKMYSLGELWQKNVFKGGPSHE